MSALACAACGDKEDGALRNLYSVTKGQQAIRELAGAMRDKTGNMPLPYGIYPNYSASIVRNQPEGRELMMTVGHALLRLCAEGQEFRSGGHQCP
jgi:hypothetical protein